MHTTGLGWGIDGDLTIDKFLPAMTALRGGDDGDARRPDAAARRVPARVPAGHEVAVRVVDRHLRAARRGDVGPALRRVPAAGDLRAARHGRHRASTFRRTSATGSPPTTSARRRRNCASSTGSSPTVASAAAEVSLRRRRAARHERRLPALRPDAVQRRRARRRAHPRPQDGRVDDAEPHPRRRRPAATSTSPAATARPGSTASASASRWRSASAQVETQSIGSAGEFYWGGAASTIFWVDPAEELVVDLHDAADAVGHVQLPRPAEVDRVSRAALTSTR